MGVEVFVADEQSEFPIDNIRWLRLAQRVLADEGVRGDAELSVLFVDEQAMSDLNQRFSAKSGPTDVLAFPIDEEPSEGGRSPDSGGSGPGYTPAEPSDLPTLLGDVVICPAVAARNAPDHAGTFDDEIALLIVHGILHLMGMDHHEDGEAEAMEARERVLLAKFHHETAPDATITAATPDAAATAANTADPVTATADAPADTHATAAGGTPTTTAGTQTQATGDTGATADPNPETAGDPAP